MITNLRFNVEEDYKNIQHEKPTILMSVIHAPNEEYLKGVFFMRHASWILYKNIFNLLYYGEVDKAKSTISEYKDMSHKSVPFLLIHSLISLKLADIGSARYYLDLCEDQLKPSNLKENDPSEMFVDLQYSLLHLLECQKSFDNETTIKVVSLESICQRLYKKGHNEKNNVAFFIIKGYYEIILAAEVQRSLSLLDSEDLIKFHPSLVKAREAVCAIRKGYRDPVECASIIDEIQDDIVRDYLITAYSTFLTSLSFDKESLFILKITNFFKYNRIADISYSKVSDLLKKITQPLPFIKQLGEFSRRRFPIEKIADIFLLIKIIGSFQETSPVDKETLNLIVFLIKNEFNKRNIQGCNYTYEKSISIYSCMVDADIRLLERSYKCINFCDGQIFLTEFGRNCLKELNNFFLWTDNNKRANKVIEDKINKLKSKRYSLLIESRLKNNQVNIFATKEKTKKWEAFKNGENIFSTCTTSPQDWSHLWDLKELNHSFASLSKDFRECYEQNDRGDLDVRPKQKEISGLKIKMRNGYIIGREKLQSLPKWRNLKINFEERIIEEIGSKLDQFPVICVEESVSEPCNTKKWDFTSIAKIRISDNLFARVLFANCKLCKSCGVFNYRHDDEGHQCHCEQENKQYDLVFLAIAEIREEFFTEEEYASTVLETNKYSFESPFTLFSIDESANCNPIITTEKEKQTFA